MYTRYTSMVIQISLLKKKSQINDEKTNHKMVAADSYFSHRQLHLGR